jgi:predicted kinase
MKKRSLIILRGCSGSGKSTFANLIAYPCLIITADDYFYDKEGNYHFDGTKLGHAHAACRDKFDEAVKDDIITNIVIANTNTRESEWKYYSDKAEKTGLKVFHVVMEKRHESINSHNVPQTSLDRQANSIKENLKLL